MNKLLTACLFLICSFSLAHDKCPSCDEKLYENNCRTLCCTHKFCEKCLSALIKVVYACPICGGSLVLHTDGFKDNPHDSCQKIPFSEEYTVSVLHKFEEISNNENALIEDLEHGYDYLISSMPYIPPGNKHINDWAQRVKESIEYSIQRWHQENMQRHDAAVMLCSIFFIILMSALLFNIINEAPF